MMMNPKTGFLSLLDKYPDAADSMCTLINRQQKDAKVIAEAVTGEPFAATAVTVDDLKHVIREDGPQGLLSYFDVFHTQMAEIVKRLMFVPEAADRIRAKAAAAQAQTRAAIVVCPACEEGIEVEQAGGGPCPTCDVPVIVEHGTSGYTIRKATPDDIAEAEGSEAPETTSTTDNEEE